MKKSVKTRGKRTHFWLLFLTLKALKPLELKYVLEGKDPKGLVPFYNFIILASQNPSPKQSRVTTGLGAMNEINPLAS